MSNLRPSSMATPRIDPADYFEIHDLYSAYNQCSDAGDAEGYAACFTAEGVLDGGKYVSGRASLIAFKRQEAAARNELYRRHWNGSLKLNRGEGGAIIGVCYLLAYIGVPGHLPVVTHSGVYTDTIVKED